MTGINNKEYLKKYLSIGKAPGEKKKKKKRKQKGISTGLKIVDDDILVNISEEIQQDLDGDEEDAPQIASVIDDRPPSLRVNDASHLKLWKPIGSVDEEENTVKGIKLDTTIKLNKPKSQSLVSKTSLKKVFTTKQQSKSQDSDFSPPRRKIKQELRSASIENDNSLDQKIKKEVLSPVRSDNSTSRTRDSSMSPIRKIKREISKSSSPPRSRKISDNSPPRKNRSQNTKDMTPPRRRKDSDNSPPRKTRRESSEDNSSSRRKKDVSPSRRRRDSDNSPPRKINRGSSEDKSPSRRKNDSDNSTYQRKKYKNKSPPRKRRDSDNSPPRNRNDTDNSSYRGKKDKYITSPRRRDSDNSPPRKNRRKSSEDNSPPRRKNDSDKSSNRKNSRWGSENDKMTKTLEGKTAGLQNALDLARETEEIKRKHDELFKNMSAETSGRNAETVIRNSIRKKQKEIDPEEEKRKRIQEEQNKEKYDRWGKGLKQVEAQNAKIDNMVHEMNKPLARYADDQDLENYLKDQEREGDPMLAYMRKKKKTHINSETPLKPRFEGEYPPNRFGIPPGYRWDGVDRSNGYEKKYFEVQNKKKADMEEAYKWSTEDM